MSRLLLIARAALIALSASLAGGAGGQPTPDRPVFIRDVNIVTLDDRGVLAHAAMLTRHGRIEAIFAANAPAPAGATVIEGHGGYLMAGLIDAHVHYGTDYQLAGYLRYGVTTIFSLGTGGSLDPILSARRRIANGTLVGPHLYATGPAVANHRILATAAEAEPFLNEMHSDGFEFIKVYNETPQDVFDAIVAGAHRRGMGVFGHMPRRFAPEYSITHGLDVIAHMEELFFTTFQGPRDRDLDHMAPDWTPDYARVDPILDLIAANHVAIIPNLVASTTFQRLWSDEGEVLSTPDFALLSPEIREGWRTQNFSHRPNIVQRMWREQVKYPLIRLLTYRASRKGILLLAGTDAPIPGVFPGRSLHQELRLLVAAGLTNEQALQTATINGGIATRRFVDAHACIGAIRPGCEADLVLLRSNPLDDIRNTETIVGVMEDGRWHLPADLETIARPPAAEEAPSAPR